MDTKDKLEATFVMERPTKNTIRYQEEGSNTVVGTLYIQKSHITELGTPQRIKITIERA
jgi:hypothetical protein